MLVDGTTLSRCFALIKWDATVKGLGLRITPNGVKSYILNYWYHGRQRRATIARATEVSLKIARQLAGDQSALAKALNQHEEQHPASVAAIRRLCWLRVRRKAPVNQKICGLNFKVAHYPR
ncbi:MAG: Arm DNA-binding domain-containing protein [Gemmatimonadota bacterium]|nr:Arm DNA-binding domain-containing protein [Gemmatimonadota bacterium]